MSRTIVIKADLPFQSVRLSTHLTAAAICSFETFYLLFLMAGRYKGDPRFQWITERFSLDITAMFLALSGAAGAIVLLGSGYRLPRRAVPFILASSALFGYLLLTVLWSPGDCYAHTKALQIGVLTVWTTAGAALVIASQRRRLERFFFLFMIFAVWLAIESLVASEQGDGGSVEALGGHYLGLGRVIGPAALVTLGYGLFLARDPLARTAAFAAAAAFCFVLLILGGRMPLLATIAGGLVPLLTAAGAARSAHRERAMWTYLGLSAAAAAAVACLAYSDDMPQTLRRMSELFSSDWGHSSYARSQYYPAAIEYWWQRPLLGHGMGAWPLLHFQGDFRAYPHNIILEILVEFGLVGLLLFIWLLAAAARSLGSLQRIAADPLRIIVLMVAVNALANAMVSGDLPDNRFLFASLGLMLLPANTNMLITTRRHGGTEKDDNSE